MVLRVWLLQPSLDTFIPKVSCVLEFLYIQVKVLWKPNQRGPLHVSGTFQAHGDVALASLCEQL